MVDFLKTGQQILTSVNKGLVNSGLDGNVEPLEIRAIHTKYNEDPFIILIEPANLSISDDVRIGMSSTSAGYGRMDQIANYSGTNRTISIGFVMIKSEVLNGKEAVSNNTITANLLKQSIYPSFIDTGTQNTSVIKNPPYFRIKYGDLVNDFRGDGLAGFITRLSITNGRGDIGDNLGIGVGNVKIPIEYSVQIDFSVLHEHEVGWYEGKFAKDNRINWPFNTGLENNDTPGGPGGIGSNNAASPGTPIPGSPAAVSAKKATELTSV